MTMVQISPPLDCSTDEPDDWGIYGDNVAGDLALVSDESGEPLSPSTAFKIRHPVSMPGGSGSITLELVLPGPAQKKCVQFIYSHKLYTEYVPHSTGILKEMMAWSDVSGSVQNHVVSSTYYDGDFYHGVAVQGDDPRTFDTPFPDVVLPVNTWGRKRIIVKNNTVGLADGNVKAYGWVSGAWALSVEHTNVRIVPDTAGDNHNWIIQYSNVWGGTGGTIAIAQFMAVGHIDIQTADDPSEFTDPYAGTPTLDHFTVTRVGGGAIGHRTTDAVFDIEITARDAEGNVLESFADTVDVSVTGSALRTGGGTTAAFTDGVLQHTVALSTADTGVEIDVEDTDTGTVLGSSAAFDVIARDAFVSVTLAGA